MSAARKAAEEALDDHASRWPPYCACICCDALRALLAEQGATPGPSCSTCDGYGYTTVPVYDRNGYPIPEQRKCDDCDGTGRAPAPSPASDEVREAAVELCDRLDGGAGERYYREVVPGMVADIEALRAALAARGGE